MSTFSDHPGWEDVIPVPQDDGPNPVVSIAYDPNFRMLMDLFRAVLRSGELSERVLELTENILDENAANYTVWQYRRQCLRYLNSDFTEELNFMDLFAEENPKNYQIWHHRRVIVEELGDAKSELIFCSRVFKTDAKNYHAWAHRQWVLKTFNLWEGELEYIEQLLKDDVRNNSAWNQRWFVVHSGPDPVTSLVLNRELDYAFASLDIVSKNESSWNYIRGLSRFHPECVERVTKKCLEFVSTEGKVKMKDKEVKGKGDNCFALNLLADLREAEGTKESRAHAADLFQVLCQADSIRAKYWLRRLEKLTAGTP